MHETFHFVKFEVAENMTILSQTYRLKYPNKAFFVRKLFFFFLFCTIFAFMQILGCWFQISWLFFPVLNLKISKRAFLASNIRISIFPRNILKLSTQDYTHKAFLVPKLKLFVSHNLSFLKSEGTYSNYKNLFKDFSLKISWREHFLFQI